MSGGHYNYKYSLLYELSDEIEDDLEDAINKEKEYTAFNNCNNEEEEKILVENMKYLITTLRDVAKRVKALEWYMSADYSIESYLEKMKKINEE